MASISGGGNYVSDGEILQWLALEQDRIYGDLRESMDLSRNRASFADALNKIKTALHQANIAKPSDFGNVDAQLSELLETYGSDPDYADLCKGLEELADPIHARATAEDDYATKLAQHNRDYEAMLEPSAVGTEVAKLTAQGFEVTDAWTKVQQSAEDFRVTEAPTPPSDQPYDDNQLQVWDGLIGGKLDLVNKNDQLNMIHIQQLKALGDQSSQLGSQFIASSDKTSGSIINNIV
jgi:hypothetical protein